jgi:hypothetical protein
MSSFRDTGTSRYGILRMKWTTEMHYYDPYTYQRPPLGYYTIPEEKLPKIEVSHSR